MTTNTKPTKAEQAKVMAAMEAEFNAEKAWLLDGADEDTRPATPLLDEVRSRYEAPKKTRSGKPRVERQPITVRFTRDGRLVPESQNVMSRMAFYFSASVNDGQRMTVDELRARLTDLGVADPEHTAWDVEMAPGKRWGAILAENTAAIEAALTAAATAADERRKAKATKSTADKPAKAAPAKAAPAKAAAKPKAAPKAAATNGKKDVTPIPKAAPKKARGKAAAPVEPVVEVPVPEQSSSLAAQASAERKAVAVWQRGGEKGDRPATPAIDAMAERAAAKAS